MVFQVQQHKFVPAGLILAEDALRVCISDKCVQIKEGCRVPAVDYCILHTEDSEIVAEMVSYGDYKK